MSDLLSRTGRALYGSQWQSYLADDLGVNRRTMRRWVVDGPPNRIRPELLALVRARGEELRKIAEALA